MSFEQVNAGIFYRRRTSLDLDDPIFVKHCTKDVRQECHCCTEENVEETTIADMQNYLSYSFIRRKSAAYGDVYMDSMIIPSSDKPYSVISIRQLLTYDVNDAIEKVLRIVFNLEGQDCGEQQFSEWLHGVEDQNLKYFPVYSKFMFRVQMSQYFMEYHSIFNLSDSVHDCVPERMDVVRESTSNICYCKDYIWAVYYQIFYFQSILQHHASKGRSFPQVGKTQERGL
jgi:hypothetical protein